MFSVNGISVGLRRLVLVWVMLIGIIRIVVISIFSVVFWVLWLVLVCWLKRMYSV